jgi:hypothetical protein
MSRQKKIQTTFRRQQISLATNIPLLPQGAGWQCTAEAPCFALASEVHFSTQRCAGRGLICEDQRRCSSRYQVTAMGECVCLAIVKAPSRSRSHERRPFRPAQRPQSAARRAIWAALPSRPYGTPDRHPRPQLGRSPDANTDSLAPEQRCRSTPGISQLFLRFPTCARSSLTKLPANATLGVDRQ